jgi:CRISPR/Cas system CSM-associated protein Csm3 (group 7 of RAMP superfamily)
MKKSANRYIGRFIIEAETPVIVGSGDSSLVRDALVAQDANGLPFIPGTTLAGVLRHAFTSTNPFNLNLDMVFGAGGDEAQGSRFITSAAYLMLDDKHCAEGILDEEEVSKTILHKYTHLPKRQHVRINSAGVNAKTGLFDNDVVYKGSRFIFEMELRNLEHTIWEHILQTLQSPWFRLGAGTRKGYGKFKVLKTYTKSFDLANNSEDFKAYLNHNPSLNVNPEFGETLQFENKSTVKTREYKLSLKPDSFFIFGQGYGDNQLETDHKPFEEEIAVYAPDGISFQKQTVLPASSIKGALSHRVAYHYNKLAGIYIEDLSPSEYALHIGEKNKAVRELFGNPAGNEHEAQAGNIIIDDLYLSNHEVDNSKIMNHVAIDRFTGGAIDGALFSENASRLTTSAIHFSIFLKTGKQYSEFVVEALENSLSDLCSGLLPLGGMTTKGYGSFSGTFTCNETL